MCKPRHSSQEIIFSHHDMSAFNIATYLQTGESGQQVGAVRAVVVGSGVVVEKLVAVDAEEHYL